jgi:hypothetical protein
MLRLSNGRCNRGSVDCIKLFSALPRLDLFDLDQAGDNRLVLSAITTLILQFAVSLHHLPLVPIALDSRG